MRLRKKQIETLEFKFVIRDFQYTYSDSKSNSE